MQQHEQNIEDIGNVVLKNGDHQVSEQQSSKVRKGISFIHEWPDELEIKIASSEKELESVFRLLHDCYTDRGVMSAQPSGFRILPQHLIPQTTILVAKWKGEIIGTASVIRDNPMGLPMEPTFDLQKFRNGGRRLAEISSLALHPKFRGRPQKLLFPLFRFILQYAKHCCGVHELVITVSTEMAGLYEAVLLFELQSKEATNYEFVNGAPTVLLSLNLETCYKKLSAKYGQNPTAQNNYQFFSACPDHPGNQLPKRIFPHGNDPIMTPKILNDFFLGRAGMSAVLTDLDFHVLKSLYPYQAFARKLDRLRPHLAMAVRGEFLMDTLMIACHTSGQILGEVLKASKTTLVVKSSTSLQIGSAFKVLINLAPTFKVEIEAEVASYCDGLANLGVRASNLAWPMMLALIEEPYLRRASVGG